MADKPEKGKKRKTLSLPALKMKKDSQIEQGTLIAKKYKIESVLGRGGMGTVYLAEDIKLDRKVAIKTISEEISKDKDLRKRLLREAKTLSKIEHPNICTIYEIVEEKGRDFIVMQYIAGNSLSEIPVSALSWENKLEIFYQIALGLKSAHNANVIHRDLKPSNIKIDQTGYVKILDFGLAKEVERDDNFFAEPDDETLPVGEYEAKWKTALTHDGTILGTVYYMSPEQARGENVDNRSDIFSLGTLMYEISSGKLPFPESDTISALYHIVNTEPVKIGRFAPGIPRKLSRLIYKTLEKDPAKRYQKMDELLQELEKIRLEMGHSSASRMTGEMKKIASLDPETAKELRDTNKRTASQITSAITTVRRQITRKKKFFVSLALLAAAAFGVWQLGIADKVYNTFFGPQEATPSIMVISKFQSEGLPAETGKAVQFLIIRSLSQLPGVWFIDENTLAQIQDKLGISTELDKTNMKILARREDVIAYLDGSLEVFGDGSDRMVEIHPRITHTKLLEKDIDINEIKLDITPGEGAEAILLNLIDEISDEISDKLKLVQPEEGIRGITSITTKNWKALQLYLQAEAMWDIRNTREAENLMKKSLEEDPDFALARGRYAEILKFKGEKIKSLENLRLALSSPEKLTKGDRLYFKSLAAELELDYKAQMNLLEDLYSFRPLDWNTSYALAEAYFHRGMIKEAAAIYEATLKLSPRFAQALNHYGYCLSYLGEHDKAIDMLKEYKDLDETYNSYDSLGDGYFYASDYDRAIRYKKSAISRNTNIDWIYRSLADFYITLGAMEAAKENNREYTRTAGNNKQTRAQAALQLAYIHILMNNRQQAKEEIDKAKALYDKQEIFNFNDETHWLAGMWYLQGGQTEKAREELDWLMVIVEKNKISAKKYFTFYKYYLHLKALIEYQEGHTEKARETMRQLVGLGPALGYWITMHHQQYFQTEAARIEYEMKSYEDALTLLNAALDYAPNYPLALFYKGKTLLAMDRRDEARMALRKYLEICYEGDDSYWMIAEARKLVDK